uniref:Uncharacterized protein n=1 Tax=viral metagenome TaxID=1070528 RepID=A0A6C0C853_9ZZZZ
MEYFLKLVEDHIKDFYRQLKVGFYPHFKNWEETYLIWYLVRDGIHPEWDVETSSPDFDLCVAIYYEAQHNNSPDEKLWPVIDKYYISGIKKESHEAVTYYLSWNHEAYMLTQNRFFKEKEISFLWQAIIVEHKYLIELFKKKFVKLFHDCCNGNIDNLIVFKNVFGHDFPLIGRSILNDATIDQTLWKYISEGHHYYIPSYINTCNIESFIKLIDIDIEHLKLYKREISSGRGLFLKKIVESGLYDKDYEQFKYQRDGIENLNDKVRSGRIGREYWRNKHRSSNYWYDRDMDPDFDEWHEQIYGQDRPGTPTKYPRGRLNVKEDYVPANYNGEKVFQKPRSTHLDNNPTQQDIVNFANDYLKKN